MAEKDKTKRLLEEMLSELYKEQSKGAAPSGESYLIAQDGQFLGKITKNRYENESLKNRYGPYGSIYSSTSIFNKYSQYGSRYGSYSIYNPYCSQPPKLYLNGQLKGYITVNKLIQNGIDPKVFLHLLDNDIDSLLKGKIGKTIAEAVGQSNESFIIAEDGTYLGKLDANEFDSNSILNEFGPYGNEFSSTSIFNQFSNYGSEFSTQSPFNEFTSTPPKIFVNGKFYGYLTKNQFITGKKVDPDSIKQWTKENF